MGKGQKVIQQLFLLRGIRMLTRLASSLLTIGYDLFVWQSMLGLEHHDSFGDDVFRAIGPDKVLVALPKHRQRLIGY